MKKISIILGLVLMIILIGWGAYEWITLGSSKDFGVKTLTPYIEPSPTPYVFLQYKVPQIPNKPGYSIFLVGDSMTAALGPHPFVLSNRLNQAYPQKKFAIDNYSEGGRNIEALAELLNREMDFEFKREPAALSRDFDVIIIESMGNNPLSHLPIDEGLKRYEEVMDQIMVEISLDHPKALVIFLATIAPSKNMYGQGVIDLNQKQRVDFVVERKKYIEKHIEYAKEHNIPLIDLYHQTLNPDGTATLKYINPDDYIHPSQEGVEYIQKQIADFIIDNNYLSSSE